MNIAWSIYDIQVNRQCVSIFGKKVLMAYFSFIINYVLYIGTVTVKFWSIIFMLWFTNLPITSPIAVVSQDYNTRIKKEEVENNTLVPTANLETKLLDGFSSLKDESYRFGNKKKFAKRKCKIKEQRWGLWNRI